MRVKLRLLISSEGLPAVLTVRGRGGVLLAYKTLWRKTDCVCFCTRERNIAVAITPVDFSVYPSVKYFKLPCSCEYRFTASFDFIDKALPQSAKQRFFLFDEAYGLPVSGTLFFNG